MRFVLPLFILFSIVACSTTPPKYGKPVPAKFIHNQELTIRHDGDKSVKFVRDSGFLGAGCTHTIFIDSKKAVDLDPGQAFSAYLKPGNHFYRLSSGGGIRPNVSISEESLLVLGEPQKFRASSGSNFQVMLSRIQ